MRSLEEDTIRFLEMGIGSTLGFAIVGLVLGLLGVVPNAYFTVLVMILVLWVLSPLFYHLIVRRAHRSNQQKEFREQ